MPFIALYRLGEFIAEVNTRLVYIHPANSLILKILIQTTVPSELIRLMKFMNGIEPYLVYIHPANSLILKILIQTTAPRGLYQITAATTTTHNYHLFPKNPYIGTVKHRVLKNASPSYRIFGHLLLALYATTSVGVGLQLHYCGGHLSSVSWAALGGEGKCVCTSGQHSCKRHQQKNNCCHNETILIQLNDDQCFAGKAIITSSLRQAVVALPPIVSSWRISTLFDAGNRFFCGHSPPLLYTVPLRLFLCIWRN